MTVVVVANPKGGVGKSTLATNIAGFYASRGHAVMLGDADRQHSSRQWLAFRAQHTKPLAPISTWEISSGNVFKPPKGTSHVVIDSAGSLSEMRLPSLLAIATHLVVPLQPGVFDVFATREFLDQVALHPRAKQIKTALVGMRVDERTASAGKLDAFLQGLPHPVVATLRNTQNYVHLAAAGATLFDVNPARVAKDLEQWHGLCEWLEQA